MSVIALALGAHPDYPLVLIANRDERHTRATAKAAWWPDQSGWLGGRDLQGGGTWFGVGRDGRFAVLTNFREGRAIDLGLPSRGRLVLDYLTSEDEPLAHSKRYFRVRGEYAPFNLLLGSPRHIYYAATHARLPLALTPGIHTLANGLLDAPWPKSELLDLLLGSYMRTHGGFAMLLGAYSHLAGSGGRGANHPLLAAKPKGPADFAAAGFQMLADRVTTDINLPDTGLPDDEEERLSACFVTGAESGTRASTALVMARDGHVYFEERGFDPEGQEVSRVVEEWRLDPKVFSAGGQDD